jgi:NAD(P)-dependent dehydrogenase (short-subunit alcohol dehydrogenase family)
MRDIDSRHVAAATELREFAREHALSVEVVELDVTVAESVSACVEHIRASGGLDAVIHNAGLAAAGLTETFTADNAESIFAVNVVGVVRLQHALLPLLRESSEAVSIYITSTLAREVMPFLSLYSASKHALDALAEGWRYELGQIGIRTVIIQPGTFPTTGMITRLLPPSAPARAEAYGGFANAPAQLFAGLQGMITSGAAPAPALVADAMLAALSPDAPTRIVVDPNGHGSTARLNDASRAEQQALLTGLGLANLD